MKLKRKRRRLNRMGNTKSTVPTSRTKTNKYLYWKKYGSDDSYWVSSSFVCFIFLDLLTEQETSRAFFSGGKSPCKCAIRLQHSQCFSFGVDTRTVCSTVRHLGPLHSNTIIISDTTLTLKPNLTLTITLPSSTVPRQRLMTNVRGADGVTLSRHLWCPNNRMVLGLMMMIMMMVMMIRMLMMMRRRRIMMMMSWWWGRRQEQRPRGSWWSRRTCMYKL